MVINIENEIDIIPQNEQVLKIGLLYILHDLQIKEITNEQYMFLQFLCDREQARENDPNSPYHKEGFVEYLGRRINNILGVTAFEV